MGQLTERELPVCWVTFLAPGGLVRLRAYVAGIGVLVAVPLTPDLSGAVAVVLEGYRRFVVEVTEHARKA